MASDRTTSAARDAYLNLVRVHERLSGQFARLFRDHGITQPQFNVLRILRGAPAAGVSCQYVGERLLNRLPDVTRLLDRMESAGLVTRARSADDRRVVLIRITQKGKRLCESLDGPVMELHQEQLAHLSDRKLGALNRVLEEILATT